MIRLNAIFELRNDVKPEQIFEISNELVEKSRKDEGNVTYDLYQSTTNLQKMLFVETWQNQEVLDKHSAASHFTEAVPNIEALTINGLKIDHFDFQIKSRLDKE